MLSRDAGMILLIADRSTAHILDAIPKVYVLRNGRVALSGNVEEVGGEKALEDTSFGYG